MPIQSRFSLSYLYLFYQAISFMSSHCTIYVCLYTAPNPCLSDPCQNGGRCFAQAANSAYVCLCLSPYIGSNCAASTVIQTTSTPLGVYTYHISLYSVLSVTSYCPPLWRRFNTLTWIPSLPVDAMFPSGEPRASLQFIMSTLVRDTCVN